MKPMARGPPSSEIAGATAALRSPACAWSASPGGSYTANERNWRPTSEGSYAVAGAEGGSASSSSVMPMPSSNEIVRTGPV